MLSLPPLVCIIFRVQTTACTLRQKSVISALSSLLIGSLKCTGPDLDLPFLTTSLPARLLYAGRVPPLGPRSAARARQSLSGSGRQFSGWRRAERLVAVGFIRVAGREWVVYQVQRCDGMLCQNNWEAASCVLRTGRLLRIFPLERPYT
jgi:hypothetical protein